MKAKPKIPLKPRSSAEEGFLSFLYLILLASLFGSIFFHSLALPFFCILGLYTFLALRHNIKDAFQKPYLKKSLVYLPLLVVLAYLGNFLIYFSNLPILNKVISLWGFGSTYIEPQLVLSLALLVTETGIIFLCLLMNYLEEYYFRDHWYLVLVWALLHLVLGLSTFTLGAFLFLCVDGVLFKIIYDKHGLQTAYITHFFRNLVITIIPLIFLILGI